MWAIAFIGLAIVLIFLLLPGGKHSTTTTSNIVSYSSSNSFARLIINGPEVADSLHQSVQIDVSSSTVTYQQLNGYTNIVANQQTYPNNEPAYDTFLRGLYYAGFSDGVNNPDYANPNGYCPTGSRYIFQFYNNNTQLQSFWTTNCTGTPDTFKGSSDLIITLFQNQVPNYDTLVTNVNI